MRASFAANSGADQAVFKEEADILCGFMLHHYIRMKPRGHRPHALPSSADQAVLAVRRIHSKQHPPITMVPHRVVSPTLAGLNRNYKRDFGYRFLLTKRKEPWRTSHLKKMLSGRLDPDLTLAGLCSRDRLSWVSYFAMLETLAQSGFRKAEVSVRHPSMFRPNEQLTRANLQWVIQGVTVVNHTAAQLAALTEDDYAIVFPPPSKADGYGVVWGSKPVYLPVRFNQHWCAAARLAELELLLPVNGSARAELPLFVTELLQPFTSHKLDRMLEDLKAYGLPAEVNFTLFSYHSFRIRLATSLGTVKAGSNLLGIIDSHIQSLCRWVSPKSLAIYNRMQPEMYISMFDAAMGATITSYETPNYPQICSHNFTDVG